MHPSHPLSKFSIYESIHDNGKMEGSNIILSSGGWSSNPSDDKFVLVIGWSATSRDERSSGVFFFLEANLQFETRTSALTHH